MKRILSTHGKGQCLKKYGISRIRIQQISVCVSVYDRYARDTLIFLFIFKPFSLSVSIYGIRRILRIRIFRNTGKGDTSSARVEPPLPFMMPISAATIPTYVLGHLESIKHAKSNHCKTTVRVRTREHNYV